MNEGDTRKRGKVRRRKRRREREEEWPLSASSNVVAMRAMRHAGVTYTGGHSLRGLCLLIVYLGIKATSCMDGGSRVCGWLARSFSFEGNTGRNGEEGGGGERDLSFQEGYLTQYHITKVDPPCIIPRGSL